MDETGKPKVHVFGGKVRAALPTLPSSRTVLQAGQTDRFDAQNGTVTRIDEGLQEFPELESQAGLPHTSGDVRYLRRAPVTLLAGTYEHDSIMIFEERADFTLIVSLSHFLTVSAPAADATGFFRVEQRAGKWLMIDPDGKPFHLRGCNHYGVGTGPANLREKYGDVA